MSIPDHEVLQKLGIEPDAMHDQTVLVTGGARGIGQAVAVTMAHLGASVVLVDKNPAGETVAASITDSGGAAVFIHADLSEVADVERTAAEAAEAFGQVDVLINNALHLQPAPIVALELENWERTFNTNARAPYLLIKALLPAMLQRQHGTIANMVAYEGSPLAAAYSGTKMALRSMAITVAREVGTDAGVSSFAFIPGIVETPLMTDEAVPMIAAMTGMTEEEALAVVAHNPGYDGFMPAGHCAAALAYAIVHAAEYHGQVADPFEPLDRAGVIEMPRIESTEELEVAGPESGLYIKQYLNDVSSHNQELEHRIEVRTRELEEARDRSEELLLSILPTPIARRLESGEELIADYFEQASVLFADIVGFTDMAATMTPPRVVQVLDVLFSRFDSIADRYQVEKIKTNGDSYMAVGGVPVPSATHLEAVANTALEMLPVIDAVGTAFDLPLQARIGIHTGNVVAGVIGRQRFIYDLWGDTVNTASRMESHGEPGRIHCSEDVHRLLARSFEFEPRGTTTIKGKGEMPTYFLVGTK